MLCAGVAWASIHCAVDARAIPCTTRLETSLAPFPAPLISAIMWRHSSWDRMGVALAVLSAPLRPASDMRPGIPRCRAFGDRRANLQLSVPLLASLGGVVLFAEPITIRLAAASVLLLGGIALATREPVKNSDPRR